MPTNAGQNDATHTELECQVSVICRQATTNPKYVDISPKILVTVVSFAKKGTTVGGTNM